MEETRNAILECLQDFADDDDKIIRELNCIAEKHGDKAFPVILHVLTDLEFPQKEAEENWRKIVSHQAAMSGALKRKVSLRTAVCDYFCSIQKSLKNPKIVEIQVFEATSRSSKYDGLTGLLNRRSFDDALVQEVTRASRYGTEFSILFFDLDDFKRLNDSMGHTAGDVALKTVGKIIDIEKRTEDIAGRFGGEEMVIILPESGKAKALVLGERIREKVEGLRIDFEGKKIRFTLSGGLASFPIDSQEPKKLLECADKAMYCAKSAGKNTLALYSQNKRRFMRIDFGGKINVQPLEDTGYESLSAQSKDLSMAGVLFENNFPLEMGSKTKLNIPLDGNSEPLLLIGTVVRVEALGKDKFDIGISFLEMGNGVKGEISKYIAQYLQTLHN